MSSIKKIVEWIKTMVHKIANLIPRRFKREPESAPHVMTPLEKELARKIQQRQAREGRPVDTRTGGPNMPKWQPCDICNRGAKRVLKTSTGAKYHCTKCNNNMYVQAQ